MTRVCGCDRELTNSLKLMILGGTGIFIHQKPRRLFSHGNTWETWCESTHGTLHMQYYVLENTLFPQIFKLATWLSFDILLTVN